MAASKDTNRRRRDRGLDGRAVFFCLATGSLLVSVIVAIAFSVLRPTYRASVVLALQNKTVPVDSSADPATLVDTYLQAAFERARAPLPRTVETGLAVGQVNTDAAGASDAQPVSVELELYGIATSAPAAERAVDTLAAALLEEHRMHVVAPTVPAEELENARFALESAGAVVKRAEIELRAFEQNNAVALPGLEELNRSAVEETQRVQQQLEAEISTLESRRVELDRALRELQRGADQFGASPETPLTSEIFAAAQARWAILRGRYGREHPEPLELGIALGNARAATEAHTRALESELEQARVQFEKLQRQQALDHPDVVALAHRVSALERVADDTRVIGLSNRDLTTIENLSRERIAIDGEINALRDQRGAATQRSAEYEARVQQAPLLEQQHVALQQHLSDAQRHLETKQQNFSALLEKLRAVQAESPGELTIVDPVQTQRVAVTRSSAAAGLSSLLAMTAFTFVVSRIRRKRHRISGAELIARLQGGRLPLAEIPELAGD